jgi:uncharacterized damage-inducible protein DinB
MTDREFFRARLEAEKPGFLKVLRALPADRMEYRPHERSPSAAEIVRTMTAELSACCDGVDRGRIEWAPPAPRSRDEMIADWERSYAGLAERVEKVDEGAWQRPLVLSSGGKEYPSQPLGAFLWFLLFDAIHHRGQLTSYIRPMGGKVPGVYGPSADG